MSISPRQVWEGLSPERQEQIIDELMSIFEEIIYEQLRISHNQTSDAQSHHLYSSVESRMPRRFDQEKLVDKSEKA